jgi:hypothetical protein
MADEDVAETAEQAKINHLMAIVIIFEIMGWHV